MIQVAFFVSFGKKHYGAQWGFFVAFLVNIDQVVTKLRPRKLGRKLGLRPSNLVRVQPSLAFTDQTWSFATKCSTGKIVH